MRYLLLALAVVSLAIGVVGIFVPGLPTTEFVLLSGWAAAQSSPRLHAWLERHPRFGPMLRSWRESRAISRRAKCLASAMMTVSAVILFTTLEQRWIAEALTVCMFLVAVWLWRRPEPARERRDASGAVP